MIKIVTVIGARPQIIKAAALSRKIQNNYKDKIREIIVHTGQHYDNNMSEVFFSELGIPKPDYNLNVGSASHANQTARMLEKLEAVFLNEKPDFIVLYGDTNSTLAGALAAAKLHLRVAHVEAGLRSFNKTMPEEVNRICCDHVSTLLFSPTRSGYNNLLNEGFKADNTAPFSADNPKIMHCGDVMLDNSLHFAQLAGKKAASHFENIFKEKSFILATVHRDNNTDQPKRLQSIFSAFLRIVKTYNTKIYLPLHPRTRNKLEIGLGQIKDKVFNEERIILAEPASFLEMIWLEKNADLILTDSGGVQKEAFFFKKPVIILRPQTEWTELVDAGTAKICDADTNSILSAVQYFKTTDSLKFPEIFGNGNAADFILKEILNA